MCVKPSLLPSASMTAKSSSLQWKQRLASLRWYSGRSNSLGRDDVQRHPSALRETARLLQVAAGKAGRIGQHGEHPVAENAMRRGRQKRGVHAAGVGHHHTVEFAQASFDRGKLFGDACRNRRISPISGNASNHKPDYSSGVFISVSTGKLASPFVFQRFRLPAQPGRSHVLF